jgi:hypothetical protein
MKNKVQEHFANFHIGHVRIFVDRPEMSSYGGQEESWNPDRKV